MKPVIKAVQEWLKTCPLVAEQLGANVAFHIDYLPERTTQFSIEDSPGAPVLRSYFSGELRAKNYVLASRMEYSESMAQQAANSGFWDEFAGWIERKSRARELPDLGEGKHAEARPADEAAEACLAQPSKFPSGRRPAPEIWATARGSRLPVTRALQRRNVRASTLRKRKICA